MAGLMPAGSTDSEGDHAVSPPVDSTPLPQPVNDFGGKPAEPVVIVEHELAPWEKRTHAMLECLYWRQVMSMEEKRKAIEDLGQTIYASLTYYQKWAVAAANHLMDKGLITQDELAAKMDEVRARIAAEQAEVAS
jgi:thiocyanate hydrolase subunit beta